MNFGNSLFWKLCFLQKVIDLVLLVLQSLPKSLNIALGISAEVFYKNLKLAMEVSIAKIFARTLFWLQRFDDKDLNLT